MRVAPEPPQQPKRRTGRRSGPHCFEVDQKRCTVVEILKPIGEGKKSVDVSFVQQLAGLAFLVLGCQPESRRLSFQMRSTYRRYPCLYGGLVRRGFQLDGSLGSFISFGL